MTRKIVLPLMLIVFWEVGVYFFSANISDPQTISFQLAARYSARTSFVIFSALLLFTGTFGLNRIYSNEHHRTLFVFLILMFAVNHFIHFIFIVMNYHAQKLTLLEGKNIFGALGYVLLLLAPAYLWTKDVLTRPLRLQLYVFFFFITIIFIVTYIRRFSVELPMISPPWAYQCFLALIGVLVILNGYRFFKEHR